MIVTKPIGETSGASGFFDRHYVVFAVAILGLALFNLSLRLGSEFVSEWDESLYAISAWEAINDVAYALLTVTDRLSQALADVLHIRIERREDRREKGDDRNNAQAHHR